MIVEDFNPTTTLNGKNVIVKYFCSKCLNELRDVISLRLNKEGRFIDEVISKKCVHCEKKGKIKDCIIKITKIVNISDYDDLAEGIALGEVSDSSVESDNNERSYSWNPAYSETNW